MTGLRVGGLAPFSTVDLPGRTAAVVFCLGCPWRCRYCHNAHLRGERAEPPLDWGGILRWLEPRQGFLEAVVFSGGEPLVQPALPQAVAEVKAMGFAVGLHTGGSSPDTLRRLLPLIDWIGLDIKAPRAAYDRITGVAGSGRAAWEALGFALGSSVPYEIRTTCHPDLLTESDLGTLARELAGAGAMNWVLQPFRPQGCQDQALVTSRTARPARALVDGLAALFLGQGTPHPPARRPGTGTGGRSFLAR
jgi:pyruvate formate lyase activating enzyme